MDTDRFIPHPKKHPEEPALTSSELAEFAQNQRETAWRRNQIWPPHGEYTPAELREYMGHQYAAILRRERDSHRI